MAVLYADVIQNGIQVISTMINITNPIRLRNMSEKVLTRKLISYIIFSVE